MIFAGLLLATLWIASFLFLKVLVRQAPEGFEDERGFHVVAQHEPAGTVLVPALRTG